MGIGRTLRTLDEMVDAGVIGSYAGASRRRPGPHEPAAAAHARAFPTLDGTVALTGR